MVELRWQSSREALSRAVAAQDLDRTRSFLGFEFTCAAMVSPLARQVFRDIGPTMYRGALPPLLDIDTARYTGLAPASTSTSAQPLPCSLGLDALQLVALDLDLIFF